VTLPMAKAKGLLSPANETELRAECPPELLGTKVPRYVETSKWTAHVLPDDSLSVGTLRTRERLCGCTGLAATTPGFIAQAKTCTASMQSAWRQGAMHPHAERQGSSGPRMVEQVLTQAVRWRESTWRRLVARAHAPRRAAG
jgi:hypothetical protein